MPDPTSKVAAQGVTVYLMEELTDARLRCEQLKKYIQDAVNLVEKSQHRDHLFEVAGHLLHGIPETLFKLDKALGAVALAATKLDYDEIKQTLKPEKVEELERALEDSRIRYVNRRSGDTPMQPNETAKALRGIAAQYAESGRFPVKAVANIVAMLRETEAPNLRLASIPASLDPDMIVAVADAIDNKTLRNRDRLAVVLETALQQAIGGQNLQALLQNAGSREEVMDGFKKENPALTPEQLKEIADQWEANKDVVKDKSASDEVTAGAGEEFQKVNPAITDEQVAVINDMHEKHKDVVKNKHAGGFPGEFSAALIDLSTSLKAASEEIETKAAHVWKIWRQTKGPQGVALKQEMQRLAPEVLDIVSALRKQVKVIGGLQGMALRSVMAVESDHESKFEKGKPADPTENMTEEQKAEWKRQNEEHREEFKAASSNFPDWPTPTGVSPEEWANALRVYVEVTDFLKPAWNAGTENPDRRGVPQMDVNIFVDWLHDMREQGAPAAEYVAQTIRIETLLKSLIEKLDKDYAKHRDDILMYIDTHGVAGKDAFRDLLFGQDTYGDVLRRMRHERLITLDPAIQGYVRV